MKIKPLLQSVVLSAALFTPQLSQAEEGAEQPISVASVSENTRGSIQGAISEDPKPVSCDPDENRAQLEKYKEVVLRAPAMMLLGPTKDSIVGECGDKVPLIRELLRSGEERFFNKAFRKRLRDAESVDDMLNGIKSVLEELEVKLSEYKEEALRNGKNGSDTFDYMAEMILEYSKNL